MVVSQFKAGRLRFLKSKPNMRQNPKTGYITMHLVKKVFLAHLVCDTRSIFFGLCTCDIFLCRGILSHNFYDLLKNICFLHPLLLLPGSLIIQQASLGHFRDMTIAGHIKAQALLPPGICAGHANPRTTGNLIRSQVIG